MGLLKFNIFLNTILMPIVSNSKLIMLNYFNFLIFQLLLELNIYQNKFSLEYLL